MLVRGRKVHDRGELLRSSQRLHQQPVRFAHHSQVSGERSMRQNKMNKQVLANSAVLLSAVLTGCIAPQPGSAQSPGSGSSSGVDPDKATAAITTPPPVKPIGTLLSDGKSTTISGVNPGGSWFIFNDKSAKGKMTPESTGDFATAIVNGAIHTQGKGFTDWGGGIGFNFVGADSVTPLDASAYTGLSFKASGSTAMHVALATKATMPEFNACTKCYDHYATDITDLTSTPKTYTFKWAQLKQMGWGAPHAAFDPKTLIGLNFTSKGPTAWDFTIDDVQFTQ
jgi:hypothetical protein